MTKGLALNVNDPQALSLTVVEPEKVKNKVENAIVVNNEEEQQLAAQASQNVDNILNWDFEDAPNRRALVNNINEFNVSGLRDSAKSNQLLQTRVGKIAGLGKQDEVGDTLMALNRQLKDIDPSELDFTRTGVFGKFFDPVRKYFDRYEKAGSMITSIVKSLEKSERSLQNDNITLAVEEKKLREKAKTLAKEIRLAVYIDEELEQRLTDIDDEDKIKFIKEQILFPLRQGIQDKQQMLLVDQQGIVSLYVTQHTNDEVIRGLQRTQYLTVSAIQVGASLAAALYNQKMAIEKINLANSMANAVIESNSRMLQQQAGEVQRLSSEPAISPETFKQAFTRLTETVQALSTYKQDSLAPMKEVINMYSEMAATGQKVIDDIEKRPQLSLSVKN